MRFIVERGKNEAGYDIDFRLRKHRKHCLARAIRDLGVYSEIYPYDTTAEQIKSLENVKGIILNGGENREVDGKISIFKTIYIH